MGESIGRSERRERVTVSRMRVEKVACDFAVCAGKVTCCKQTHVARVIVIFYPRQTHGFYEFWRAGRLSINRGWGPRDVTAAQPTLLQGCVVRAAVLQNIIFLSRLAPKSASNPSVGRMACLWGLGVQTDAIIKWGAWNTREPCCGLDF